MSDTADPPKLDVNALISDLRSHTVHLSLLNLAMVSLVILASGAFYLHTVQNFDKLMAKADTQNSIYQQHLNDFETQWKADQQTIAQLQAQKQQVIVKEAIRDTQTVNDIQTVTQPSRDAQTVANDVLGAYQFAPEKLDGDLFTFTQPETQQFVATKLDRDRLSMDVLDDKTALGLEEQKTAKLTTDLASASSSLTEANKTIKDFKKVAKKSKFKQLLSGAEKVGLFVGGLYIGKRL